MLRICHLDQEEAELMAASAAMAVASLEARCKRVDGDGILARSAELSRLKMAAVLARLDGPPLLLGEELSGEDRGRVLALAVMLVEAKEPEEANGVWQSLQAIVFQRSETAPETWFERKGRERDLRGSAVESDTAGAEAFTTAVRAVPRKKGNRKPPQGAA